MQLANIMLGKFIGIVYVEITQSTGKHQEEEEEERKDRKKNGFQTGEC